MKTLIKLLLHSLLLSSSLIIASSAYAIDNHATDAHTIKWQLKFNAQLTSFMSIGLSGPFPMFFIMDENNQTLFYGKGINSQAYQQFAEFNFPQQIIKDDISQLANAFLPSLIQRQSVTPLNGKKLVVISLDEASFKTPEQDKCVPCRALFSTIDTNQRKLTDMDKILINVVHQN